MTSTERASLIFAVSQGLMAITEATKDNANFSQQTIAPIMQSQIAKLQELTKNIS